MSNLLEIPFHGDTLVAVQQDGKNYVAIRRICNAIGINYATQYKRLTNDPSAVVVEMTTTGSDGKAYEMVVVDWEYVPLWLAKINPLKVDPMVKHKLIQYQQEVKDVLAAHFLGTKPKLEPLCDELDLWDEERNDRDLQILANLIQARRQVLAIKREQDAQWAAIKQTELIALEADESARRAEEKAEIAQVTVQGSADFMALVGFARLKGLQKTERELSNEGRWFSRYCRDNDIEIKEILHQRWGKQNIYRVDALEEHWYPDYCRRFDISPCA